MTTLLSSGEEALFTGDVLRLPENYELGPGSPPVDLMVFEPHDEECGLGLLVLSGYKAGLIYALLPPESLKGGSRAICTTWLKTQWHRWFCYEHDGAMRVIDVDATRILPWNKREIVETA